MVLFTFKVQMILILAYPIIVPATNVKFNATDFRIKRNNLIEEEKLLAVGGKTPYYFESEIRANGILMKYKSSEVDEGIKIDFKILILYR